MLCIYVYIGSARQDTTDSSEISTVSRRHRGVIKEDVGALYNIIILCLFSLSGPTAAMCIENVFK